ncbi:CDP-glycerol:poly(glycerophosphate) glycerophosphotransferase [hydrothermal vent metagenome]|uniref:CDP-glycerol:poly(Glycerophosphate) glycerophosphotransferase n=1 Tax=hydrothermal vent metagenome TaxID=652676 RepID=A0A3B0X6P4_9ZZZZ
MNITLKQSGKISVAFLIALFGWPVYALAYLMPRDSNKYVFGIYASSFSGNTRTLYVDEQFAHDGVKVLLYKEKSIKTMLDAMPDSNRYLYFSVFSVRGIYHALTAKYYVYSSYLSDINFWLSNGAVAFNVWHGTPLKTIERDVHVGVYSKKNKWRFFLKYIFPYFYVRPNKILVCSDYEQACFKSAFNITDDSAFVCSFPPRLNSVVQQQLICEKSIILYCPTWRDDGSFVFQEEADVHSLNQLMLKMNLTFVIKSHPSDKALHLTGDYSNVILESNLTEVYSCLPEAVALVTDYSSMLFDAVYCGVPTILFCPDLEHYQNKNREFYIDIHSLGLPVVTNEADLFDNILRVKELGLPYEANVYFSVYKNKSVQL